MLFAYGELLVRKATTLSRVSEFIIFNELIDQASRGKREVSKTWNPITATDGKELTVRPEENDRQENEVKSLNRLSSRYSLLVFKVFS